MSTKKYSPAGIALTIIVLCYVCSALILRFGKTERAIGMGAAIVCALLGLLFLVLSLPLGKLLNRAPKLPLFHFGWPRSSSEWSVRLVAAAIIFFAIAAAAFYWGTDPAAKPAFIRWLDSLFQ